MLWCKTKYNPELNMPASLLSGQTLAFSAGFCLLGIPSSFYKLSLCSGKFFIHWFFQYSTYSHPLYGLCHWSFILFAVFLFLSISDLVCALKCIPPSTEIIFLPLNVFPHACFCHYVLFRLHLLLQFYQTRAMDSSLFPCCRFSLNSHRCNTAETEIEHFKVLESILFQKPALVLCECVLISISLPYKRAVNNKQSCNSAGLVLGTLLVTVCWLLPYFCVSTVFIHC